MFLNLAAHFIADDLAAALRAQTHNGGCRFTASGFYAEHIHLADLAFGKEGGAFEAACDNL
jgi:hypothetical protein